MSKIYSTLLVFILLALSVGESFAQAPAYKKADRFFEGEAYPSAATLYLAGLEKEFDQIAAEKLAKCYAMTGEVDQAIVWYEKATAKTKSGEVAYAYAQLLKTKGEYKKAASMFDRFGELSQNYELARTQAEACERAEEIKGDGQGWKVASTDLNTPASDFGPWIAGNSLYFVSSRTRGFFSRVLNLRNDNLFYDVYAAKIKGPVNFEKAKLQRRSLKTRFHDGPLAFTKNMQTVYITRSNFKGGKLQRDGEKRAHLQLYSAQLKGKKYKKAVLLPFNGNDYSTGHPALTPDGKTMVFASDRKGGMGGSDLYITHLEKGEWSKPISLGPEVNSSGDELFPYISNNGLLYFSSNGLVGLGGLDIFQAFPAEGGTWNNVMNLGGPLNSPMDDFAIVWDNQGHGYFSSNRAGGAGQDDIYRFNRIIPLKIQVVSSNTGNPVENARIKMLSSTGTETPLTTDAEGNASTYLEWGKSYRLNIDKNGYRGTIETIDFDAMKSAGGRELKTNLFKYPEARIDGIALAADGGAAVPNTSVRLVGEERELQFTGDAKGQFAGKIDTADTYTAIFEKNGYFPGLVDFTTYGMTKDQTFPAKVSLKAGKYVLVEGIATEKGTGKLLADASVRGINATDSVVSGPIKSRIDGKFWMVLDRNYDADVILSRDGYFTTRVKMPSFKALENDSTAVLNVEMVPAKVGEIVKIIYYDYRESNLTSKAKNNLEEIVFFLLDNPRAVVELSSHTDSRGTGEYNAKLSEARAKAAVDYVISRGIKKERIVAKGYGEGQLSNDCGDEIECTDEQHAANRRTEIKVTAIN